MARSEKSKEVVPVVACESCEHILNEDSKLSCAKARDEFWSEYSMGYKDRDTVCTGYKRRGTQN